MVVHRHLGFQRILANCLSNDSLFPCVYCSVTGRLLSKSTSGRRNCYLKAYTLLWRGLGCKGCGGTRTTLSPWQLDEVPFPGGTPGYVASPITPDILSGIVGESGCSIRVSLAASMMGLPESESFIENHGHYEKYHAFDVCEWAYAGGPIFARSSIISTQRPCMFDEELWKRSNCLLLAVSWSLSELVNGR